MSKFNLFLKLNFSLVFAISIAFRLVNLDHIPGINGDEAWYGVQMFELNSGSAFSWRTPTGNVLNPFFSGLIFILHLFSSPSFWILRLPAAISGILTIILTYYLISKVLGKKIAILATILVASLPINIAYSRYGWDQSQGGLASIIAIYFSLQRNWIGLVSAVIAAFIVHPTNILLLPFIGISAITPSMVDYWQVWKTKRQFLKSKFKILLFIAIAILSILLATVIIIPKLQTILGVILFKRLLNFQNWCFFFLGYGRLLSGITIYRYICGIESGFTVLLHDVIFWCLFLLVLCLGIRQLFREKKWNILGLVVGLFLTLIGFYLIAGFRAIMPSRERYATCLIIPSILVIVILINSISKTPRKRLIAMSVTVAISWLLLWSFQSNYFDTIKRTGGLSEQTFRTASVEPKQQALAKILQDAKGAEKITIFAEDWWLYWPIQYLSIPDKRIKMYDFKGQPNPSKTLYAAMAQGAYAVGFSEGPVDKAVNQLFPKNLVEQWAIEDYSGRSLLNVWHRKVPSNATTKLDRSGQWKKLRN
jgi:hypothetical protein